MIILENGREFPAGRWFDPVEWGKRSRCLLSVALGRFPGVSAVFCLIRVEEEVHQFCGAMGANGFALGPLGRWDTGRMEFDTL